MHPVKICPRLVLWALFVALVAGGVDRPGSAEEPAAEPDLDGLRSEDESLRFETARALVARKDPATLIRLKGALAADAFRASRASAAAEFVLWKLSDEPFAGESSRRPGRPDIVLVSVDTLRADHLGCHGNQRETSPAIDGLARSGAQFMNAISPASWTLPAHMSMFTSLYPSFHKVESSAVKLDASISTLPEVLKAGGYTTAGFVTHSFLASEWGFARGFDRYDMQIADAAEQTERAVLWLDWHRFHVERELARPNFFLFVHYIDPHETYSPPPPYLERYFPDYRGPIKPNDHLVTLYRSKEFERPEDFRYALALYDGEIAFVDAQVEILLKHLRAVGLEETSLVILTSDHGEEFKDHGSMGHKQTLYDEQLRVPLIIRYPRRIEGNQRIGQQVSLVDIYPTVLDLIGLVPPAEIQGRSLVGHLRLQGLETRHGSVEGRPVFAELGPLGSPWNRKFRSRVVRTERYKLIFNYLDDGTLEKELYVLDTDPKEEKNVYESRKTTPEVRELEVGLKAFIQEGLNHAPGFRDKNPVDHGKIRDEVLERLKALGYMEPESK